MSFVGGKLKLKGGSTLKVQSPIKKKKKKPVSTEMVAITRQTSQDEGQEAGTSAGVKETPEGWVLPEPGEEEDRRTEAERKYDEWLKKREKDLVKKHALKSHRERVADFNEYLANLSEHHDIPKVGPG